MSDCYTKDGKKITFKRILNFEPDENRGWVVHALLAEVDGDPAGYLKISYIPTDNFKREYPDVFHYVAKMKGWVTLKNALKNNNLDERIRGLDHYGQYYATDLNDASLEDRLEMVKTLEKQVKSKFQKDYLGFKEYHVDKPLIDFIRVYDDLDNSVFVDANERIDRKGRINYKRQGVASALYKEAALWLKELNLQLHASTLQQPEAKAAWEKMKSLGLVSEIPPKTKIKPYNRIRQVLNTDAFSSSEPTP